jgi:hypothetical protein
MRTINNEVGYVLQTFKQAVYVGENKFYNRTPHVSQSLNISGPSYKTTM